VLRFQTVVLSPAIVVRNWEAEFKKFVPPAIDEVLKVIVLDAGTVCGLWYKGRLFCALMAVMMQCTNMDERLKVLRKWDRTGGILLMGYELFRILCGSNDPDGTLWRPL
jgi:SNF2 family DNA or RNA helicase